MECVFVCVYRKNCEHAEAEEGRRGLNFFIFLFFYNYIILYFIIPIDIFVRTTLKKTERVTIKKSHVDPKHSHSQHPNETFFFFIVIMFVFSRNLMH